MRDEITILDKNDSRYPELLREIHDPPEQLFVRGIIPEGLCIAVVGARLPSSYGKAITPKIVEPLAAAGAIIVSGLAYGIDALAHEAALAAHGKTIAVLGTGVDDQSLYPQTHRKLASRIIENDGTVISEYSPGTEGKKHHFPARNRIIAGLSRAVIIVEAKEKSGALITADLATRENRDVYAVPGPINSSLSAGTNQLIRDGATPLLRAEDIIEAYDLQRNIDNRKQTTENEIERGVLDALAEGALHVDELGRALNLPTANLSSLLTTLELKGLVRNLGGGLYGRA